MQDNILTLFKMKFEILAQQKDIEAMEKLYEAYKEHMVGLNTLEELTSKNLL